MLNIYTYYTFDVLIDRVYFECYTGFIKVQLYEKKKHWEQGLQPFDF